MWNETVAGTREDYEHRIEALGVIQRVRGSGLMFDVVQVVSAIILVNLVLEMQIYGETNLILCKASIRVVVTRNVIPRVQEV